jgi:hypothetical protein
MQHKYVHKLFSEVFFQIYNLFVNFVLSYRRFNATVTSERQSDGTSYTDPFGSVVPVPRGEALESTCKYVSTVPLVCHTLKYIIMNFILRSSN